MARRKRLRSAKKGTKVGIPKTVLEVKPEVVETKPAEARLICNHCGGELLLVRKSDNQTMYECSKCHRGLAIC
ncbi:MAG: hypothetical protein ACTSPB_23740 [Candidatus Thorarchaeota archaeon]